MRKNKLYSELTELEKQLADSYMKSELKNLDFKHPIRLLFHYAWEDYKADKFTFDGATFSKKWHTATSFEIAALVHDWRNSMGFVGYAVDREMFDVMITLNYGLPYIIQRYILTRFTFLNIIRHRIKGTFKGSKLTNLYKL
jgi:hypothetical protein